MKTIRILNLAAGQGKASEYKDLENTYVTKAPGDATHYVQSVLENATEDTHFCVYGGDGTVNEVVSSIMRSGSDKGYMSVVPVGTGNDLVRSIEKAKGDKIDVLTVGDGYAINAINTGFDLEVVLKAAQYKKKPLISGALAYILGVISVFTKKFG
jgi:diacylglycerol kinase family enzyme